MACVFESVGMDGVGHCGQALGLQQPGRSAGLLRWLPCGQQLSVFPRLAAEHQTQSIGRRHLEQQQAPAEGLLPAAKTGLAQR